MGKFVQNKRIIFIALIFLLLGAPVAQADQIRTAPLGDAALASYISGRLKPALSDEGYTIDQYCDASGCAVVVQ